MSRQDSQSVYAAAQGREFLRGELEGKPNEWVREFAGLVDDRDTLDLLNYYCSLWNDVGEQFLDTRLAKIIIRSAATRSIDEAFRAGNVSQLQGMVGLTNHSAEGTDVLTDASERLENEGSIGLVLGPPGAGKTALTLDIARVWAARTGGYLVGNTTWDGFDEVVKSDTELLEYMASVEGPVLAVIDETAQELSGFGSGNKLAEAFSDSLTFIRKCEAKHGPYAKRGVGAHGEPHPDQDREAVPRPVFVRRREALAERPRPRSAPRLRRRERHVRRGTRIQGYQRHTRAVSGTRGERVPYRRDRGL